MGLMYSVTSTLCPRGLVTLFPWGFTSNERIIEDPIQGSVLLFGRINEIMHVRRLAGYLNNSKHVIINSDHFNNDDIISFLFLPAFTSFLGYLIREMGSCESDAKVPKFPF